MANPYRGEAELELNGKVLLLRPTFEALVKAEEELGPLFALVDRAAGGLLTLKELAALFWHCLAEPGSDRAVFSEAVAAVGLANLTPALKTLIGQILKGR